VGSLIRNVLAYGVAAAAAVLAYGVADAAAAPIVAVVTAPSVRFR
jgi:hypothetical protein